MTIQNENIDVVFVGGGPVGLWTAVQTKIRNPELNIIVLEKYSQYQRIHSLFIEKISLQTDCQSKDLDATIALLSENPNLSTASIEKKLSQLAEKVGIVIERNQNIRNPDVDLARFTNAKVIVGADGAHSIMRQKVVGEKDDACFAYQHTNHFIADLTYADENPALDEISKILVQITLGNAIEEIHDKTQKQTTLRTFISEEVFEKLKGSTRRTPESLDGERVDASLRSLYLQFLKLKYGESFREKIDLSKTIVTTTSIGSYASKRFVHEEKDRTWCTVGDAAFGVPFFRSLNNGLLCGTELSKAIDAKFKEKTFSLLGPSFTRYSAFVSGLSRQQIAFAEAKSAGIQTWESIIAKTA